MTPFRIGERVVLKACTDFPGTVTGFGRGKVEVLFDDFRNDAPRVFRVESLQLAGRSAQRSVPKGDASGTWKKGLSRTKESVACERRRKEPFGTPALRIANGG
jgi:hypothetical protein